MPALFWMVTACEIVGGASDFSKNPQAAALSASQPFSA
jgi:hypothetical protein